MLVAGMLLLAAVWPAMGGDSLEALKDANRERNAGRLPEAERTYRTLLDDPVVDERARLSLARVLSWQGKFEEAVEQYRELRDRYPNQALEADIGMARSLAWGGNFREAVEAANAALAAHPGNPDLLLLLGQVESWAGRTERSVETFDRLLALQPDNRRARIGKARAISWSGGFLEAEREYRGILERFPDFVEARVALVHNLIWMGRTGDASEVLDSVAPEDRHRLDVRLAGIALERSRGNRAAFRSELETLRTEYPGNTDVRRFTRLEVDEVGPLVRTRLSWVRDSDELDVRQYMVGASVPLSPSVYLFLEGRGNSLSDNLGLTRGNAGGATAGLDLTVREGLVVRAWGGSRLARDAGNGFMGGVRVLWRPLRNVRLSAGYVEGYADYTPESVRNDVSTRTLDCSVFFPVSSRVSLTGAISRREYDGTLVDGEDVTPDDPFTQKRDLLDGSIRWRLRGKGKLRPAAGLRGQYFRFDETFDGAGYFNPEDFRRLLAFVTLTRRHRERTHVELDLAYGIKKVNGQDWESAYTAAFALAVPIRRQVDLTAKAAYSRLSITTGNYSSRSVGTGLRFRLK